MNNNVWSRSGSWPRARERKRLTTGKCEGRKSHAEINPEMVQIAKGLRRRKRGNSLRAIAADLAVGISTLQAERLEGALDSGVLAECLPIDAAPSSADDASGAQHVAEIFSRSIITCGN